MKGLPERLGEEIGKQTVFEGFTLRDALADFHLRRMGSSPMQALVQADLMLDQAADGVVKQGWLRHRTDLEAQIDAETKAPETPPKQNWREKRGL